MSAVLADCGPAAVLVLGRCCPRTLELGVSVEMSHTWAVCLVATSYLWSPDICNVASAMEELNFKLHLIVMNFKLIFK